MQSQHSLNEADQNYECWLKNVYQGDHVPQLTVRAVLMGGILGSLMSVSNLYTSLKLGWGFGVAITSCVLSFVIWNALRCVFRKLSPMSILENNCMQSTASSAGSSTGATLGSAFAALLLITGQHVSWWVLLSWTVITACLGVLLAVPMKRQMINHDQLRFPSGVAAAETLRSLYSRSAESIHQAYGLVSALVVGVITGFLSKGEFVWQKAIGLKLPDLIAFNFLKIGGTNIGAFPGFGFEPSCLLMAAGMIVGLRVSLSMFFGSAVLYLGLGPWLLHHGMIQSPNALLKWALWGGTALMVTSGLTSFALKWKTIVRSLTVFNKSNSTTGVADTVEVPNTWFVVGVIPLTIAMTALQYVAFSITPVLGLVSVIMSFFLSLVACRATGETDITPIGAMGKITQLFYGMVAPSNISANLMTASVTANTAASSADLLTDLKSGYLLGANARKQFIAQFLGVFFGTVTVVPAWYLMVPNKATLEAMNPPAANMWKAVAEALSNGIDYIPVSARIAMLVCGLLGIVLALCDQYFPRSKRFLPSAMGLGLSWVMPFANCFSFMIGAMIAVIWARAHKRSAETFTVPVASGAIAGESLACAGLAILNAALALGK